MNELSLNNSPPKIKTHFSFLDSLRGIAAFWVLFYHTNSNGRLIKLEEILPDWLSTVIFKWGSLGVSIFFVLSGFVIAHSLREAKVNFNYLQRFTLRRFARLSPPYYVSILIALAFALISSYVKGNVFAPMGQHLSVERLLTHLFYAQSFFGFRNIDDVYWTLCLEVQFYLVFSILLGLSQWLERRFYIEYTLAMVFVPAAFIAVLYPLNILGDGARPITFLPLWYGFLLGVFAYWSWQCKLKNILFYGYATILLVAGIVNSSSFAIACVITAITILEVAKANCLETWLNWRCLQFLGKISYSLYLTHVPLLGAVIFIVDKLFHQSLVSDLLSLVLGSISCVGFAAIMWQLVEKPSIKLSQNIKLVNSREIMKA
ncbi:acyltransferase family protein [Aliinostoc sp. HNIBRCY26]|uniref:acyltransferase family protein n=1 Tax=Aliinostoc sp. HNIBRCY26 TaxID=3418997 RepID=UPI003D068F0A